MVFVMILVDLYDGKWVWNREISMYLLILGLRLFMKMLYLGLWLLLSCMLVYYNNCRDSIINVLMIYKIIVRCLVKFELVRRVGYRSFVECESFVSSFRRSKFDEVVVSVVRKS